jgi:hypothetical protein
LRAAACRATFLLGNLLRVLGFLAMAGSWNEDGVLQLSHAIDSLCALSRKLHLKSTHDKSLKIWKLIFCPLARA